mmetsp:Transcript_54573/g.90695  ORF Transcript_54573/g.90695 Transcript_54573/m.90695 type:complete len:274 (-) Transcript_54573:2143-2964(-)
MSKSDIIVYVAIIGANESSCLSIQLVIHPNRHIHPREGVALGTVDHHIERKGVIIASNRLLATGSAVYADGDTRKVLSNLKPLAELAVDDNVSVSVLVRHGIHFEHLSTGLALKSQCSGPRGWVAGRAREAAQVPKAHGRRRHHCNISIAGIGDNQAAKGLDVRVAKGTTSSVSKRFQFHCKTSCCLAEVAFELDEDWARPIKRRQLSVAGGAPREAAQHCSTGVISAVHCNDIATTFRVELGEPPTDHWHSRCHEPGAVGVVLVFPHAHGCV